MFDLPNAKRVKRSEAISRSPSPLPSTNSPIDYGFSYDLVSHHSSPTSYQDTTTNDDPSSHAFKLFSNSAPTTIAVPEAVFVDDAKDTGLDEGRLLGNGRPECYYFTSALSPSEASRLQQEFALSAISFDEILLQAKRAWPGTFLPWKVKHLKQSQHSPPSIKPACAVSLLPREGRSKPNKKRRIAIRKLHLARNPPKPTAKDLEEREKAERQKRNIRNREKKIKRRERERKKKAASNIAGGGKGMGDTEENSVSFHGDEATKEKKKGGDSDDEDAESRTAALK